jgi:hypothetical protein
MRLRLRKTTLTQFGQIEKHALIWVSVQLAQFTRQVSDRCGRFCKSVTDLHKTFSTNLFNLLPAFFKPPHSPPFYPELEKDFLRSQKPAIFP